MKKVGDNTAHFFMNCVGKASKIECRRLKIILQLINMDFIKDIKTIGTLSPDFITAFEEFMPRWLDSLVPYYKEGKAKNVEMVSFHNICLFSLSDDDVEYEKNGIGYYLFQTMGLGNTLAFNSSFKYHRINWFECFRNDYPEFDNQEAIKSAHNYLAYSPYMSRLSNTKPPYDLVAKRVEQYFKKTTGDSEVGFSLGFTSFIYYSEEAKKYINRHYYLD